MNSGCAFAVAAIIQASKGSPRKSGTKMIVFPDGKTEFTVGGGAIEETTIKKCIQAIKEGKNKKFKYKFNTEMLCGGEAEIFIEVYKTSGSVIIFGGGHIGLALSKILDILGMPYIVVDDRVDFATNKRFPNAYEVKVISYENVMREVKITENSYCVIITHGHKGDKKVLSEALKSEAAYIGMIGSQNKVETTLSQLEDDGLNIKDGRLFAPIGLDIGGNSPQEIALSIAAQIVKNQNAK